MNSKNQQKKKEIDWMITLVPLALIVAYFSLHRSSRIRYLARFDFCLETPLERITWSSDLAFSFCLCFWQAPNTEILCLESRMRSQNIPFLHGDA